MKNLFWLILICLLFTLLVGCGVPPETMVRLNIVSAQPGIVEAAILSPEYTFIARDTNGAI